MADNTLPANPTDPALRRQSSARDRGADERTPSIPQYFSWINNTREGSTETRTGSIPQKSCPATCGSARGIENRQNRSGKEERRDPLLGSYRNPGHFMHRNGKISAPGEAARRSNRDAEESIAARQSSGANRRSGRNQNYDKERMTIMKKRMRSSGAAALLALSLLLLSSCSEKAAEETADPGETVSETPSANVIPEAVPEETEPDIYRDLPTGNWNGADFGLLQYEETSAATSTVCVEDLNGEAVNDAIYTRTVNVSDRLGVNIAYEKMGLADVNRVMGSNISAGDDTVQAFWQHSTNGVTNFLVKGFLLDQNGIAGLDFSNPWWSRNAMDSLRLNDRTYLSFGDINYYLFDFQSIIIANTPRLADYNMADPYTLVREGEWTIDAFLGLVKESARDLNGDGKFGTAEDLIGFTGYPTATELGFTHAADVELFSRDAGGSIVYDGVSEKYFDVVTRYSAVMGDKTLAVHGGGYLERFRDGGTMFTSCSVGELSTMREVNFDYAVLPFPKYDTAQEDYISFITNQMQPMMIPITVADTERAGIVLENLSAESYKLVREKYFEELVNYKYVRDENAVDILRMLYAGNARFEIGHVYNWGQVENTITAALDGAGETFISSMGRIEKIILKGMDKTMEKISD